MELKFTGKITEISEIKTGTTNDKEWASLDFEVTESNPNNPQYPQIGSFGYFKNGEYAKYAKEFKDTYKLGDEVEVEFNLKCVKYKKDGLDKKFYKTEAWRINKAEGEPATSPQVQAAANALVDDKDDLPF